MSKYLDSLNARYNAVLQSGSDHEFFENIHGYIDFIVKTPILAKIIKTAEEKYHKAHFKIWHPESNDEKEIELRSEQTDKLERFNLFASHYVTLHTRIYLPFEEYKTTEESDADQDPVALIMLKGLKNVLAKNYDKQQKQSFKWGKNYLKIYNSHYERMRKFYEGELRQFHLQFKNEIEKIDDRPEKTKIFIDENEGIYRVANNKKLNYPIRRDSKRSNIINFLTTQKLTKLSELKKLTGQKPEVIMQEINRINKAFRHKLKLTEDLIIHHKTSGYALNQYYIYSLDGMK